MPTCKLGLKVYRMISVYQVSVGERKDREIVIWKKQEHFQSQEVLSSSQLWRTVVQCGRSVVGDEAGERVGDRLWRVLEAV